MTYEDDLVRVERERVVGWTGQLVLILHYTLTYCPPPPPTVRDNTFLFSLLHQVVPHPSIDFASLSDDDGGLEVSRRDKSAAEY